MSNLAILFAGAFFGAIVTFGSMCFAYCAGRGGEEEKENGDDEDVE